MAHLFSSSITSGEYAWNVQRAELESEGILANLVGWDAQRAGGVYTYGGSGCWTYQKEYASKRYRFNDLESVLIALRVQETK